MGEMAIWGNGIIPNRNGHWAGEMVSCIPNIPRNELDIVDMITL